MSKPARCLCLAIAALAALAACTGEPDPAPLPPPVDPATTVEPAGSPGDHVSFFVIGTMRPIFFDTLDESLLKRRVLVYGTGDQAAAITRRMRRRSDQRSFTIEGFVQPHCSASSPPR